MKTGPFLLVILNSVAISIIYITSWSNCHQSLLNDVEMSDVPLQFPHSSNLRRGSTGDDEEEYEYGDAEIRDGSDVRAGAYISTFSTSIVSTNKNSESYRFEPSFLKWEATAVEVPENWEFKIPKYCRNDTIKDFAENDANKNGKVIVHFHMQHNAGTEFYAAIKQFVPCATRACWQTTKHCLVSYNEQIEAENLRQNYKQHGVQYVSYELMLPPKFSLPFVSEAARDGLYFTTIVRDPFRRFLTYLRRTNKGGRVDGPNGHFWRDFREKQDMYAGDNLNVRWLSGARGAITKDHVNIAKCRLQLFDLVILDVFFDNALRSVLCPINGWVGKEYCNSDSEVEEHKSNKADPLEGVDKSLVGAWVERLRPSFEVYDYAKLLSLKQLKEQGATDLPAVSEVPLYMETMEFCNEMKIIWRNGGDSVPDVYGIGAIKQSWTPTSPRSDIVKFMDPRMQSANKNR
eukprot:CCRYP_007797-RA/>CCRYP_007797-RA protein AED:0.05 eAED:0.05 QI:298/1/1/1/0.5/0.33/3/74/459